MLSGMNTRTPIPLRPDYSGAASSQHKDFWRGMTKQAVDMMLQRTATTVATTTTATWAQELTSRGIGPVLNLAPASVAAALAKVCIALDFTNVNQILIQQLPLDNVGTWTGKARRHPSCSLSLIRFWWGRLGNYYSALPLHPTSKLIPSKPAQTFWSKACRLLQRSHSIPHCSTAQRHRRHGQPDCSPTSPTYLRSPQQAVAA